MRCLVGVPPSQGRMWLARTSWETQSQPPTAACGVWSSRGAIARSHRELSSSGESLRPPAGADRLSATFAGWSTCMLGMACSYVYMLCSQSAEVRCEVCFLGSAYLPQI